LCEALEKALPEVGALIALGADARVSTYTWRRQVFGKGSGQLPLHWAAESGHEAVVRLLVASTGGCHAAASADERGLFAHDLAKAEGHAGIAADLREIAHAPLVALEVTKQDDMAAILP
jgi:hypothetical protein